MTTDEKTQGAKQLAEIYQEFDALIKAGDAASIQSFPHPIPWRHFLEWEDHLSSLLTKTYRMPPERAEDVVLALLDRSMADGMADILTVYECAGEDNDEFPVPQPIDALLDKGFDRVLIRMCEHGFDPAAEIPRADSAIAYAEQEKKTGSAELLRSFVARHGIEGSKATPRP